MARKRIVSNPHKLTVRQVLATGAGDHTDGRACSFACAASPSVGSSGTPRQAAVGEMGLGVARRGSTAQAGDALTLARGLAHAAREQLTQDIDPIDSRDGKHAAARAAEAARKATPTAKRDASRWHAWLVRTTSASSSRPPPTSTPRSGLPRSTTRCRAVACWAKSAHRAEPPTS